MAMDLSQMDLTQIPAAPPPPGVMSNFDNPESRAYQAHIGMGTCMALSGVFVLLRVYVKITKSLRWTIDDVFLIFSWAAMAAHNGLAFTIMDTVIGIHIWDVRLSNLDKYYGVVNLVSYDLFALAALSVKLSLLFLYLNLFGAHTRTQIMIYVGMALCTAFYLGTIVASCIIWIPSSNRDSDLAWLARSSDGARGFALALSQGIFGTISDIYLITIPLQCIAQLHMSRDRRWGVASIFLVGFVAIGCSIGTLIVRAQNLAGDDGTWGSLPIYIFSGAEVSAGMICCCLPVCAPLMGPLKKLHMPSLRYFSRITGSTRGAASHTQIKDSVYPMVPIEDSSSQKLNLTGKQGEYTASAAHEYDAAESQPGIHVKREFSLMSERQEYPRGHV